mmetsp:Transcript_36971/g.88448  ORF Transcript_36971/g.88448 Transcript_36971/m.88448 type:complete len:85 (-) Transcript_36971:288-542(-)
MSVSRFSFSSIHQVGKTAATKAVHEGCESAVSRLGGRSPNSCDATMGKDRARNAAESFMLSFGLRFYEVASEISDLIRGSLVTL